MNRQDRDILLALKKSPFVSQRVLSEQSGYSLGAVNQSLKNLLQKKMIDSNNQLKKEAELLLKEYAPKNAIILAAGYGMRMVPINHEMPKALLEIHGEPLIERIIKQLHQVGITEIYVVGGFMVEQLEYLIDEYCVELIVNDQYPVRNNLHSLALAAKHIANTYIVPCDIWCENNPFCENELYSWYMISDAVLTDSSIRMNRKKELVKTTRKQAGNKMIGISYLAREEAKTIRSRLAEYNEDSRYHHSFWEEVLYQPDNKMLIQGKLVSSTGVTEINTYEQLRELDQGSNNLKSDAIDVICRAFGVIPPEIRDITILKKGMTNRSFLFSCKGKKYIMRIPGEGTGQLINRQEEADVYQVIKDKDICDSIVYINPENGYKITEYYENTRVCDPENDEDLLQCMKRLKAFHQLRLHVPHTFDLFGRIDDYEKLWEGKPSAYRDYQKTKENIFSLKRFIEEHADTKCLTHIDAVPDNFLFVKEGETEQIRLIDWEYAGMQDPHIDVAMFCIYALYNRKQVDHLIDLYFENRCPEKIRTKIYCYIAACGLLWSNWCEYKRILGIEFGEYSLRQYRYAKDYYRIAKERIEK